MSADELDPFRGHGVRVELPAKEGIDDPRERYRDSFHVVKETLTRIGVASSRSKFLYQSAHILHKRGQYAILHFKELFSLDGKPATITEDDIARRNTIAKLLEQWGLLTVRTVIPATLSSSSPQLKIISFQDKPRWTLVQKYELGGGKHAS